MATQPKIRTVEGLERKYNFAKILGLTANVENTSKGLLKIENELNGILNALVINLSNVLGSQSDISLWFFSGIPTTTNEPYISWVNPNDHIGDIYYDKNSGTVYQWNNVWEVNTDPDLVEAMALTNAATDTTTDHERKVFFDTPTIPYSNGDWWIKEDGSLFICQISKTSGTFENNDFISTDNYTESVAEKLGDEIKVLKGTITTMSENYAKFTDLATGGSTTIAGENISTGSIQSNNYVENVSGMKIAMNNGTIDSKNFKTDTEGNVYLGDGAKVIGGQGLLSNLQNNSGGDFTFCGFTYSGYYVGTTPKFGKEICGLTVYIPSGFTITEAKVTLYHFPIKYYYIGNDNYYWGYSRNLKLYKADTTHMKGEGVIGGGYAEDNETAYTEISGAFGTNGYTPSTPSDSDYKTESTTSIDIKNNLTAGMNKIAIMTSATTPTTELDAAQKTGKCFATINIIGYMSYE